MSNENDREITLYAKITNMDGLSQASKVEHHLQYEAKLKNGSFCRLRITTDSNGNKEYEFTSKVSKENAEGITSFASVDADVDAEFEKVFANMADHKLDKTRFVFDKRKISARIAGGNEIYVLDLPELKFEVDVFKDGDGKSLEWCKIDFEIDELEKFIEEKHPEFKDYKLVLKPQDLPFKPEEVIFEKTATASQKDFVQSLWKDSYRIAC